MQIVYISWKIKCLVLKMQGETMKVIVNYLFIAIGTKFCTNP